MAGGGSSATQVAKVLGHHLKTTSCLEEGLREHGCALFRGFLLSRQTLPERSQPVLEAVSLWCHNVYLGWVAAVNFGCTVKTELKISELLGDDLRIKWKAQLSGFQKLKPYKRCKRIVLLFKH